MTCCCEGSEDPTGEGKSAGGKEQDLSAILPDWKRVFVNRQEFLKALGFGLGGLIGLLATIPPLGFAFNYFFMPKREGWVTIGAIDKYKVGETINVAFENPGALPWDGVTARNSAWLRRDEGDKFMAWAINCTHLGCPVRWEAGAKLFLCPCHGGVYDSNGDVAGGPPPRPMHQYPVRVANGQVEIKVRPVLNEA
jgi:menaquinol-cytochrome c reductase iron-sulfur subunit